MLPPPLTEAPLVIATFAIGTGVSGKLAVSEFVVPPDVFGTVWLRDAVFTTGLPVLTVIVMMSDAESPDTRVGIVQVTVGTPPTDASLTVVRSEENTPELQSP